MNYTLLIIGCALATYIPRMIPLTFLSNRELGNRTKKFLAYIPYTSLSILIVRGIITASSEMLIPSIVGISVAGVLAYIKGNLILSVLSAIVATFITIQIM